MTKIAIQSNELNSLISDQLMTDKFYVSYKGTKQEIFFVLSKEEIDKDMNINLEEDYDYIKFEIIEIEKNSFIHRTVKIEKEQFGFFEIKSVNMSFSFQEPCDCEEI